MVRLSDLIKRGIPPENGEERKKEEEKKEEEKEEKEEKKEPIRFRELSTLRTLYEELRSILQEGEKPEPPPTRIPKRESPPMRLPRREEPQVKKAQEEAKTLDDILSKVFSAEPEPKPKPQTEADLYENASALVGRIVEAVKNNDQLPLEDAFTLVTELAENPNALDILYKQEISRKIAIEDLFGSHSINVMIYAMKVGIGLGYQKNQLIELGVSGLFHDVGMLKIPEEIINKQEKLTNEELDLLKRHPEFGLKIISELGGSQYSWLLRAVHEEHEREGGQGYPSGLKAQEIHEYAKVIGIVDVYEALTHVRSHRRRYLPFEAIKQILETSRGHFPAPLLKAVLQKLSIFPIGSFVQLSSRAIGQVIETHEVAPLRPTVEILYDSQGKRLKERKIVNLQETPILSVLDSLSEEDLPSGN